MGNQTDDDLDSVVKLVSLEWVLWNLSKENR
jgi:hypothetical protein